MAWIKRILGLLLVMFSLSGCTMLGTYMDAQNPAPAYRVNGQTVRVNYIQLTPTWVDEHNTVPVYVVGPYDILNVIVWNHPNLTTVTTQLSTPNLSGFLVSNTGIISFPLVGDVKVAGLTLLQIETVLEHKLKKYIRNPQVTVRVVTYRSQEAQVMGELVGGARTLPLTDRPISLLDAINSVGGTNVTSANTARIYVIRGNEHALTVFAVNAKSPEMMMAAQRFIIKNNDIIYVSPLAISNWNRIISQLLPSFGAAQTVQSTAQLINGIK